MIGMMRKLSQISSKYHLDELNEVEDRHVVNFELIACTKFDRVRRKVL